MCNYGLQGKENLSLGHNHKSKGVAIMSLERKVESLSWIFVWVLEFAAKRKPNPTSNL